MDKIHLYEFTKITLNSFLKGNYDPWTVSNIRIEIDIDDDNFWDSAIYVKKKWNGRWLRLETFYFFNYYKNNFQMICEWWYDDLLKDITTLIQKHYEEPKKKEW